MKSISFGAIGLLGGLLILGYQANLLAQGSLQVGGSSANFGVHQLAGGFTPDPKRINVTSGGSLDVRAMGHGPGCVGYATARPDVIAQYTGPASFLRVFFQPSGGGDTSLIINDPAGNWLCNDDTAGVNPQVDINNPRAGQYDIWVASYRAGENISGTLQITELRSVSVSP